MTRFIADKLQDHLTSDSGVSDIVQDRVFPDRADSVPDDPFIIYQRISTNRVRAQDGPSQLMRARYQIDSYARDAVRAAKVGEAVRQALQDFSGQMGDTDTLCVSGVFLDDEDTRYEEDNEVYRVRQDYLIWVEEDAIT